MALQADRPHGHHPTGPPPHGAGGSTPQPGHHHESRCPPHSDSVRTETSLTFLPSVCHRVSGAFPLFTFLRSAFEAFTRNTDDKPTNVRTLPQSDSEGTLGREGCLSPRLLYSGFGIEILSTPSVGLKHTAPGSRVARSAHRAAQAPWPAALYMLSCSRCEGHP